MYGIHVGIEFGRWEGYTRRNLSLPTIHCTITFIWWIPGGNNHNIVDNFPTHWWIESYVVKRGLKDGGKQSRSSFANFKLQSNNFNFDCSLILIPFLDGKCILPSNGSNFIYTSFCVISLCLCVVVFHIIIE